jgi:hypothetical protein
MDWEKSFSILQLSQTNNDIENEWGNYSLDVK